MQPSLMRLSVPALLVVATMWATACEWVDVWQREQRMNGLYKLDSSGRVSRVSSMKEDSEVARADARAARETGDPGVTELEVEETHFEWRGSNVTYRGTIVFRCQSGKAFCWPASRVGLSGNPPQEVFWRWPAHSNAFRVSAARDPDLPREN